MTAVLERTKALVQRAAHAATPVEEARSCAVLACRAIVEHALLAGVAPPSSDEARLRSELARLERSVALLARELEQVKRERDKLRGQIAELERAAAGKAKPPPAPKGGRGGVVELRSRYDGECRVCGGPYREGDRVAWRKGRGAVHPDCRAAWEASGA